MKILYVITKADEIGGAQVHVRDLAFKAMSDGHQVKVIVGEEGLLKDNLEQLNINVEVLKSLKRNINALRDFSCVKELCSIIREFSPDVVALHSSKAGVVGRLACYFCGVPSVFTVHGWAFADGVSKSKKYLYLGIEKLIAPLSEKIITVSKQDKDLAIKYNVGCHRDQVVIHNGIRDDFASFVSGSDVVHEHVRLIMVARFSKQKDHKTLLLALKKVEALPWSLRLVGKGPELDNIIALSKSLNLYDRIEFLGERRDVPELLIKSDIFLLISNWEGYPLSILEAKSASLPVICSNVGGVNEAVVEKVNGFLIERGDYIDLSSKLRVLIENKEMRKKIAAFNRRDYVERHTLDVMYDKTIDVYKSALVK
ncbi:glycosyltransferase family 4 protein [Vibrio fortis]|uniref:glycosyltransferase family 4 protein n=1 Tax=Vibrio fortis TaxID=212667 RepID=UPI0038CD6EA4